MKNCDRAFCTEAVISCMWQMYMCRPPNYLFATRYTCIESFYCKK